MRPDIDVLVAGAGGAGLSASLAAAAAGASVLLVESNPRFRQSCNTALSTSMIPAAGSRWQQAEGIDDSPERFLADVQSKTHGQADPEVASALTSVAPELVAWLADSCGVPLDLVTDFAYPGHSRNRCHAVPDRSGSALHKALLRMLRRRPAITLDVPCRLDGLLSDDAGAVLGAALSTPDGVTERVTADAVVLATNGFGADKTLVRQHLPEMADALYFGGESSTGDALRAGQQLGADSSCLDSYQGHGSVAVPHGVLLTWAVIMHGGVQIDALGRRFADETCGYSEFGRMVLARPGGYSWVVFDEEIDHRCRPFADYQRCREIGAVNWASDVVELAEIMDVDSGDLAAELFRLHDVEDGVADEFGRTLWPHRLTPPFGAVKVTGALFHTQGGLKVDRTARVLRHGVPVPGLYAAGGAAVGMSGHGAAGYLAGNGLLAALGLGYLAGRSAAGRTAHRRSQG